MTGPSSEPRPDAPVVRDALAAAADGLARRAGLSEADRSALGGRVPLLAPRDPARPCGAGDEDEDDDPVDPGRLGRLHQALLDPGHRHRRGVHYTPAATAALVVGIALADPTPSPEGPAPTVCDPSCGGGVFLLAAADHLRSSGHDPRRAVEALHGIDLDPLAVEVTRAALLVWAATAGVRGPDLSELADVVVRQVVAGDALHGAWPAEGSLAVVVGNPPFGGQLARSTARDPRAAAAARDLLGGAAAGYADTAGLFLVRAAGGVAPGGRVALVQPLSFLAARDAGAVRRRLAEVAVLESVWLPGAQLFEASVDVCVPVLTLAPPLSVPEPTGPVQVLTGATGERVGAVAADRLARAGTWGPVVAAATGVPDLDLADRDVLGSWGRATAGFRDEFYALGPFVTDLAPDGPGEVPPDLPPGHARLLTAGLVEPARTLWGRRTTRLAGRRLHAPAVELTSLRAAAEGPDGDRRLAAWADARVRPKVVVATQTRVVEVAVDDTGTWWPSVPVISVVLDPERDDTEHRWLVAAALSAPPVTAWAAERSAGTALAAHALKLSARQVLQVPLPVDTDAWAEGARLLRLVEPADDGEARARRLAAAGRALTDAHDLPAGKAATVLRWWAERAGCGAHI